MRKGLLPLAACLAIAAIACFNFRLTSSQPEQPVAQRVYPRVIEKDDEESEMDEMDKAISQEYERTKDPSSGNVPLERLIAAKAFQEAKFQSQINQNPVPGITWAERGPNNVGGRTRTILYDANVPAGTKVWSAGVGGGLWYTNDITAATPVWNKIDDLFDNMAITSIAQDPGNPQIMYFGTGEGWFNVDAIRGLGIWKSIDGGTTWTQLTNTNNSTFYNVQKVFCPAAGVVLAATRAGGVRRSTDGGVVWTQTLGSSVAVGPVNSAADIENISGGNVYATLGIFDVGGIYRSTDNGATFASIYNSATDETRIEIATAPSNPDIIYALVSDVNGPDNVAGTADDNRIKKIMRTINATTAVPTWTTLSVPSWCDQNPAALSTDFTRTQSWYDLIAKVDPTNADIVYIGGVDVHKTINGGTSWTQISSWTAGGACVFPYVHADIHDIAFKPGTPAELIIATDGGLHRSTNSGTSFTERNTGFNITQFYGVAIHPTLTNYFLAGAQDNGTHKFTAAGLNNTVTATGGDGGLCHIDQDNGNVQITSFTGNSFSVSSDGGNSFISLGFSGGSFINPTDYDDASNNLYAGFAAGSYLRWQNPAGNGPAFSQSVPAFSSGTITHISVSPSVANRVYFGLNNGSVVRVDNANGTIAATAIRTGTGSVSCLAVDPSNEDHMLVTYSNFGVTSIFETLNGTAGTPTWASVEGNLQDMPVRWAMFDPRNSDWAIIATELGIWSTNNLDPAGTTDWDPTNAGFANTRIDMLQYRPSDRTVAAASHGRGLYTTTIPAATTPNINFEAGVANTVEQTVATSACRGYRDFTVNMLIENAPTGNANLTLAVRAGNTATRGVDFEFTTNGNFAVPSSTLTFPTGSTAPRAISIRVYDDAEVEPTEQFIIDYTIGGGTDAIKGTSYQSYSLLITDNDVAPFAPAATTTFTIGTNANAINAQSPLRSDRQKHKMQMLFTAAQLTAAGMTAGNLTSMNMRVVTKNSTQPYQGFTINIANTATTSLTNFVGSAAFTQVWTGNYSSVVGDNTFTFGTGPGSVGAFAWSGTGNLLVQICFDNSPSAPDGLADIMEGNNTAIAAGTRATAYSNFSTGVTPGCSLPAALISDARISATFTRGNVPATVLNTTRTEYFGPNADLYFYSGSNIVARLRNLSGHDYGCTQITVDRAGTGATPFWNNNPANYLMDKTVTVVPANNNPSGSYEITLYFTQAEVNGWQTATGQTFSNIQLIKVGTKISDVTPANPSGGGTVNIVTPTRGTYGTGSTLIFSFSNGFSGFGAGVAGIALPVGLLDFTGRLKGNNVVLDWSTTFETNSKGFDIERSYDGTTFTRVGYVGAAGNSTSKRTYVFTDPEIAQENNYYRLKQLDADNKFEYSKVALVKNPKLYGGGFKVLNNPFATNIDIQFAKAPQGTADVKLYDVAGKVLYRSTYPAAGQTRMRIDLSGTNLSAGTYVLEVVVNNERYVERVIKK
ncbi:MAG: T9SS type A sorting domain-containing protein [Chitinophagaceae bacterium]